MTKTKLWIGAISALLLAASAQAEMITLGGDQTAGTGTLTINQDITFELTVGGNQQLGFIFRDIVLSDGGTDILNFSGLTYSIDGMPPLPLLRWDDNFATSAEDVTPNDGRIYGAYTIYYSAGSTVTLHAGTGTMTSTSTGFNPWSSGDYEIFVANPAGTKISDNGVVPEPATAGLLGISAVVFYALRRIKNFNRSV